MKKKEGGATPAIKIASEQKLIYCSIPCFTTGCVKHVHCGLGPLHQNTLPSPPPPNTLHTEEGAPEKRLDPHTNNGGSEVDEPVGKEWRDSQKHDVPQHVLVVSTNLHIKIKKIITAANNFIEQLNPKEFT